MVVTERVQLLSAAGITSLPAQFVRPAHERPENSKAVGGVKVPKISLSQPRDRVVQEICAAAKEWGFFLVTEHGISPEIILRMQEAGKGFFQQPQEEKEKHANELASGGMEGYGTKMMRNHEQKVEWLDYYFHLLAPPAKVDHAKWPSHPPWYREANEQYGKEVVRVVDGLLEVLSEGLLGLEKRSILKEGIGGDEMEMEMKINMYPPCPEPELALGVEPHTDMSALTILVANQVPGLQIWKHPNWVAVDYFPHALYVHIGDQIEILSNGEYKSVLHRSIVNKEQTRMSWAVFCVPPKETLIGRLAPLIKGEKLPLFKTKTFNEFRHCKINKLPQEQVEEHPTCNF